MYINYRFGALRLNEYYKFIEFVKYYLINYTKMTVRLEDNGSIKLRISMKPESKQNSPSRNNTEGTKRTVQ